MGQKVAEDVLLTTNNIRLTKRQLQLEQYFSRNFHIIELLTFAQEFGFSESYARKVLSRHNKKCNGLYSRKRDDKSTKQQRNGYYYHYPDECNLTGQNQEGLSGESVPLSSGIHSEMYQEQSDSAFFDGATLFENVPLFFGWLPEKFQLPMNILDENNFAWDLSYGAEMHGMKFQILTNYYPDEVIRDQIETLLSNRYARATFEIGKGYVIIDIGPQKKNLKYGFSGHNIYSLLDELSSFLWNIDDDLKGAKVKINHIILCDLAQDHHRVHKCLNRDPITIKFNGYIIKFNEYMVKRGEDHPHYNDPDFDSNIPMRRQEIRFLNKKSIEIAGPLVGIMDVKAGLAQQAMALTDMLKVIKTAASDMTVKTNKFDIILQNHSYQQNKLNHKIEYIDTRFDNLEKHQKTMYLLQLYIRKDIDEFKTELKNHFNLKMDQINQTMVDIEDLMDNTFDEISDQIQDIKGNVELNTDLLKASHESQKQSATQFELVAKFLEQLHTKFSSWQSTDLGIKLYIIGQLYGIHQNYTKVAQQISALAGETNENFRVSRQAITKLLKKYANGTQNQDRNQVQPSDNTDLSEDTVSETTNKPIIPFSDNRTLDDHNGTLCNLCDNTTFKNRMDIILNILDDGSTMSKNKLAETAKGSKNTTLQIIDHMVYLGLLKSEKDPSSHKTKENISKR